MTVRPASRAADSALRADISKFGPPPGAPDDVEMGFDASSEASNAENSECEQCDSQAETEVEVPIERTTSQLAKQKQVLAIKGHLTERQEAIQKLKTAVDALAREGPPADGEAGEAAVKRLRTAVDDERKRARNYGEDLLQDLLSLDKLSGLIPEDRASRKGAIALIEALLDDVDAAKSKIGSLETRVAALEAEAAKQHSEAATVPAPAAAAAPEAPSRRSKRPPHSARASAAREPTVAAARPATARAAGPPMPTAELWEQVDLPLRLRAEEEEDRYVILVAAQGIRPEDVKLRLDDEESSLSIRVLRQPQALEAVQMQQQVSSHLRQLAMRSPAHLEQVRENLDELAADAYARLGQGVFGRFSKTVEVPDDADVAGIQSVCRNGVLQVVLPKRLRRSSRVPTAGFPREGARGYPREPRGRPQGLGHPLFGGMGGGFPF